MPTIHNLEKRLRSYLDDDQIAQVVRAYHFAEQAHEGQYRRTGDPYITHPLAVANILTDMHMDHASLMAAMLHDVIEDTGISKEQLAGEFSEEVAELVDGVSKIAQIKFESKAEQQAENLRKMMLAMTRDIRVILIKLADRLHNMRTLHVMRADFFGQQQADVIPVVREAYHGHLMVNMGYSAQEAADLIAASGADSVAFGTAFLANPDLPYRIESGADLNQANPETFYSAGAEGYTDYPALSK